MFEEFVKKLKQAIDLYVPCKNQAAAKYMNKPVPNLICKLINNKRMLWSKLKKHPNKSLKYKYNYTARAIKFAIKQYNDKKTFKTSTTKKSKTFLFIHKYKTRT